MTIPEIGTIRAEHPPIVVLTSNRTRDLHDALKRRCLYHWIDYPGLEQPPPSCGCGCRTRRSSSRPQFAAAVQRLRSLDAQKPPGVAEAIDWLHAVPCSASPRSTPMRSAARSARC